jgi:hypothetical protein
MNLCLIYSCLIYFGAITFVVKCLNLRLLSRVDCGSIELTRLVSYHIWLLHSAFNYNLWLYL